MIRLFHRHFSFLQVYVSCSVLVFLGVEYSRKTGKALPDWVFHYLNDLLCIPIVGYIGLWAARKIKGNTHLSIPWWAVATVVLLFAVYFEGFMPLISSRYTADGYDVVCYGIGGLLFYGLQFFSLHKKY